MIGECIFCNEIKELNLEGMCEQCDLDLQKEIEQIKKDDWKEVYYDKF